MLGGADNPNGELLSYIIGADISSRTAISAFATATTALRTMINRLIIRFSITGGNHRCLLLHCLSQRHFQC